jgi:hypothetical protein
VDLTRTQYDKTGAMLLLPFRNESYLAYFFVFNNVVVYYGGTPFNVDTLYIFCCLGSF